MNQNKLEKRAKQLALAHLNKHRTLDGMQPLARLERLWWSIYGKEWIAKAEREKINEFKKKTK